LVIEIEEEIAVRSRGGRDVLVTIFQRFGRAKPKSPWNNRKPIREELFSVERLEEHARSLAIAQPVASGASRGSPLARRLVNNAAALLEAHRKIAKAIDEGGAPSHRRQNG
jgi:cyclic beta-1,2-glucan synthetase